MKRCIPLHLGGDVDFLTKQAFLFEIDVQAGGLVRKTVFGNQALAGPERVYRVVDVIVANTAKYETSKVPIVAAETITGASSVVPSMAEPSFHPTNVLPPKEAGFDGNTISVFS